MSNKTNQNEGADASNPKMLESSLKDRFDNVRSSFIPVESEEFKWEDYRDLINQYTNYDDSKKLDTTKQPTRWCEDDVGSSYLIFVDGISAAVVVTLEYYGSSGQLVFSVEEAFGVEMKDGKSYKYDRFAMHLFSAGVIVDSTCPITQDQYRVLTASIEDYEFELCLELHSIVQDWALLGVS